VRLRHPLRACALALLASSVPLAGCNSGTPRSCTVSCSAEGECPDGTSCGADGYCYAPDEAAGSCSGAEIDSSVIDEPDGSIDRPDASLADASTGDPDARERPDADIDPPDGCSGPQTFSDVVPGPIAIPDGLGTGINSVIAADAPCVVVGTVEVRVDITHTFRGDLSIFLTAPNNDQVVLLAPSSDPADDVHEVFIADIAVGDNASGEWILTVIDDVIQDSGTLDRWAIGINRAAP
jgi:hypothetical protein